MDDDLDAPRPKRERKQAQAFIAIERVSKPLVVEASPYLYTKPKFDGVIIHLELAVITSTLCGAVAVMLLDENDFITLNLILSFVSHDHADWYRCLAVGVSIFHQSY